VRVERGNLSSDYHSFRSVTRYNKAKGDLGSRVIKEEGSNVERA
jgi:hypothetical protein